jgi:hypothetical protein
MPAKLVTPWKNGQGVCTLGTALLAPAGQVMLCTLDVKHHDSGVETTLQDLLYSPKPKTFVLARFFLFETDFIDGVEHTCVLASEHL